MAKPLEERKYHAYLKLVDWRVVKGSVDYSLLDENGSYLCSIKVTHGKKTKREIAASSVRKTEKEFKERGWSWPPQKRLKSI